MTGGLVLFGHTLRLSEGARDHLLVTIWIIVTFKQFRYDELILYPLALYFFWAFIRDFDKLFDLLLRSLILWAFPIWFFLTLAWGSEPGLILKTGLQLLLTIMICYCAVLRLSARQIMLSVMIAAGWFGILSAVDSGTGGVAERGVFRSKNALGGAMVMLFTAALCVSLDRMFRPAIRVIALFMIVLAIVMILRSNSATAVLLALGSLGIILGLKGRGALSTGAVLALTFFVVGLGLTGAALYAAMIVESDPIGAVLAQFGKDTTLTGRTVLWEFARQEIALHPWLGVGHGGFWTPNDPFSTARVIYDEFYKSYRANFSFHNTYFEIAVHQGLIGVGLTIATAAWIVARILPDALIAKDIGAIYFVCIALITMALSFTEVALMVPFKLGFMLFVMGGLLAAKRVPIPVTRPVASQDRPA